MVKLVLMAVVLSGCANSPTVTTTHDAATDLATSVCQRRIACDPEYTVALDDCVAWTVDDLCSRVDCDAEYQRTETLEACLASYDAATCDDAPTICGL